MRIHQKARLRLFKQLHPSPLLISDWNWQWSHEVISLSGHRAEGRRQRLSRERKKKGSPLQYPSIMPLPEGTIRIIQRGNWSDACSQPSFAPREDTHFRVWVSVFLRLSNAFILKLEWAVSGNKAISRNTHLLQSSTFHRLFESHH